MIIVLIESIHLEWALGRVNGCNRLPHPLRHRASSIAALCSWLEEGAHWMDQPVTKAAVGSRPGTLPYSDRVRLSRV